MLVSDSVRLLMAYTFVYAADFLINAHTAYINTCMHTTLLLLLLILKSIPFMLTKPVAILALQELFLYTR